MQCPKAKPSSGKVVGFLRGKEVSIWKAKDVIWLRREWRIVGGFSGSLPLQPRQNVQLGLPLTLMLEEAALLVDRGVLEVRAYSSPEPASEAERVMFSELREEECARQLSVYCERKERARREFVTMETCPEGVEVEREECEVVMSHKRAKLESSLAKSDASGWTPATAGGEGRQKNVASFSPLVCIHTADPRTELCPFCFPMAELNYPETETEVLRYRVFCDLWRKGNYITSGVKYGGDYLVYPGDPSLVHSHYIAIVLPWQQPIPSLVAAGRLGSKVKKNTLFCSVSPEGMIKYFTLQWAALS